MFTFSETVRGERLERQTLYDGDINTTAFPDFDLWTFKLQKSLCVQDFLLASHKIQVCKLCFVRFKLYTISWGSCVLANDSSGDLLIPPENHEFSGLNASGSEFEVYDPILEEDVRKKKALKSSPTAVFEIYATFWKIFSAVIHFSLLFF